MASSTQGAMIVVVKNRGKYNDKTYFLPTSEQANSSRVNDLGSVARGALLQSDTTAYVLVIKPRCNANRPI